MLIDPEWDEFGPQASAARDKAITIITNKLVYRKSYEDQQEEIKRLRDQEETRKKKELEELKIKFIKGAIEKKHSKEHATELLNELTNFSKYCFNKSHCVSYARIMYITAYLKYHYPEIYMFSWLNHSNIKDDLIDYFN